MIESNSQPNVLDSILSELHNVLGSEKVHLNSGRMDLLESFAREKLQILANLDRFSRNNQNSSEFRNNRTKIEHAGKLLQENLEILKLRINAIGEITKTIEDAVTEAESDGTYEVRKMKRERAR